MLGFPDDRGRNAGYLPGDGAGVCRDYGKARTHLDIPARLQQLHDFTAGNTTIKSAFDMALYDIAAKNAGLPLYQYLGGSKREVETDITIGIADRRR